MKPWVIVDVSYIAHRARYACADLEWEDFSTGIMFGFFEQLLTVCSNRVIASNKVLCCFDSRKSYRQKAYPAYKANRTDELTPDEIAQLKAMREQLTILRKTILPAIGIPCYRQTGCESDDLMAMLAAQVIQSGQQAVLVTADGDLWQCVNESVRWYDPGRDRLVTEAKFKAEKGITTMAWGAVKRLAGCGGDNVAGIRGVGEATAIKYLLGTLPSHHQTYQRIESEDGRAIYERNGPLVVLPHPKTKSLMLQEPHYNSEAFFAMCKRYGFLSYLKSDRKAEWMRFFRGGGPKLRKRKRC